LPPLNSKEILEAVFTKKYRKQGKVNKKDFDLIKMIGKGGFSNVYEGIFKKIFFIFL